IEYQNKIYFSAAGGLWVSDGTSIGTQLVKSGQFYYLTVFNNKMYMMGYFFDVVDRNEVFESDGTTAGTIQVSNINQTNYAEPQNFIVFNNMLFFKADDGTHGHEIWTIDEAGNVSFFGDLGLSSSYGLGEFYEFDNKLFFGGDQDINGVELWYTD